MAIDFSSPLGKVRALTGDTDEANQFLTDDEINVILGEDAGIIRLSAATALEVMASKHANIDKKIEALDLKVDGAAVAESLRRLADSYRKQYAASVTADDPGFDIAEMIITKASYRDELWSQMIAES